MKISVDDLLRDITNEVAWGTEESISDNGRRIDAVRANFVWPSFGWNEISLRQTSPGQNRQPVNKSVHAHSYSPIHIHTHRYIFLIMLH